MQWIHSWLDLICLGDVCIGDSGLSSHLERQSFFQGQPCAYEMWSMTIMMTARFICQMGTWLVLFSAPGQALDSAAKLLKGYSLKQRKFPLVSENSQPDLWVWENCSLKPSKALTTPGGRSSDERNSCTQTFGKSSNFSNSGEGKIGFRLFCGDLEKREKTHMEWKISFRVSQIDSLIPEKPLPICDFGHCLSSPSLHCLRSKMAITF